MKVGALIPCRTGSRGIIGKNFRELCGKPLWGWTFDVARKSEIFDLIIVSSDKQFDRPIETTGCKVFYDFRRPAEFATDKASLDPLLVYYADKYPEIEMWCLLQPTSPLRTVGDIKAAYKKVLNPKYDSLVSVTKDTMMYWIEKAVSTGHIATYHIQKRPNRQNRKGFYREVGAIYFAKDYVIKKLGLRLGGTIGLYKMPKQRSYSINDELDWKIVTMLMERRHGRA